MGKRLLSDRIKALHSKNQDTAVPTSETIEFDEIIRILRSAFKNSEVLERYHFYLEVFDGSNTARIMMHNPNNWVAQVYYQTIQFRDKNAYFALSQDKQVARMLARIKESGRILGIAI